MKDIVFVSVPFTDTKLPLMAPAVLKSIALAAGKTSVALDLNIQFINYAKSSPHKHELINFFKTGVADPAIEEELFNLFYSYATQLLAYQPSIIGISVFTYHCQIAAKYLSLFIKKLSPTTKVIIGGAGIVETLIGKPKFAERLLTSGLIDFYIRGDGEHSLYDYLTINHDSISGLNCENWKELTNEDLIALPTPDYDDYNFSLYETKGIPILGSRGCVRNCTFCDIHSHWTKFSWRTGEHIFNEMLELNKKYNIYSFTFQDSLINGNLKEYRKLMQLIANYNSTQDEDHKFIWSSFFILRPESSFTEEDWRLTAEGGGLYLIIGIETFNDASRFHLGKKFTNEDIEFGLQMAKKYKIKFILLYLIGYVTDTEQDVDFAVEWLESHAEEYRDTVEINLGSSLGITEGTPLKEKFNELKLVQIGVTDQDWINPNTGNTPAKRAEWYLKLKDAVARSKYKEIVTHDNRYIVERMLRDHR